MRKRALALFVSLVLLSGMTSSAAGVQVRYDFVNKLVDSSDNAYNYGYAPSIIYQDGVFHMFYCSPGTSTSPSLPSNWDSIRYVWSNDGRTWSEPRVMLEVSSTVERAACDPSVVYYDAGDGPYYYLFYTGNKEHVQGVIFVARAEHINGTYGKYTVRGTWERNATDPQEIITPQHPAETPVPDGWYGAGQPTIVVRGNTLVGRGLSIPTWIAR